jgi:lipopolysaccharide heptosyltransferase II
VLLTTPLIRLIKNRFPESKIHFVTYERNVDILKHNLHLHRIIALSEKSVENVRNLIERVSGTKDFDVIIDLQNTLKTRLITGALVGKVLRFNKRRLIKFKMVYLKYKPKEYELIPDLYIKTANQLGIDTDNMGLEFWLPSDNESGTYLSEKKIPDNCFGIAPGAYHYTKRFPLDKFIDIAKRLINDYEFEVILLGGQSDKEICDEIHKQLPTCKNYAGRTTLVETSEYISKCRLVISNDTSIMHIAAARQIPVVAIYGSTIPELGFTPYKCIHRIVEAEVPCRPCTHYGRRKCPQGHFKCMNDISVDTIMNEVRELFINK